VEKKRKKKVRGLREKREGTGSTKREKKREEYWGRQDFQNVKGPAT